MGNFNIHDPLWSSNSPLWVEKDREDDSNTPNTNTSNLPDNIIDIINPYHQIGNNTARAEQLKMLLEEIPLIIITLPGLKTQPATLGVGRTGSTIDLCMTSWEL
jgi:hypothetical protein